MGEALVEVFAVEQAGRPRIARLAVLAVVDEAVVAGRCREPDRTREVLVHESVRHAPRDRVAGARIFVLSELAA